ncbi:hypothetical protein PENSTE_c023G04770 [Penicillium steckii]|uniref:F-box domain-containing protein n=1 Tax=Penicillium steckii TaxID=303698 RepID=A0A1V6SSN7_9EURO|nr:hypothetical protein PENSTE_c023G04770 [Penicillium steckii]
MLGTRLDNLPFDVLYEVATLLDYRDYIHLSRVNHALREGMRSEHISRKIVENGMLHSKEGQQSINAATGYRHAISHYYDINEAVATATPYLISVLAYGTDFIYQQGILCYCTGHELRLLDVHQTGQAERVVNFHDVLWRLVPSLRGRNPTMWVKLVHYCDDILAFRVFGNTDIEGSMDLMFAMDVAYRHKSSRRRRLLLRAQVPAGAPIFVRCNRSCIWYGYSTATTSSECGPWRIYAFDLLLGQTNGYPLDRRVNGDLGQTVCFEVFDGTLYAISTVEKANDTPSRTSYYYWFCYNKRRQDQPYYRRLWRRENGEGPIDDSWTKLSMRLDEVTGQPVIVECRREWPGGKSESRRACYIVPLPISEETLKADTKISWSHLDPVEASADTFSVYPNERPCHSFHAEFDHTHDHNSRREFITARTKLHTYNLSAATFLDLVNDRTEENGLPSRSFLRIRAVSRTHRCPIDDENGTGLLFKKRTGVDSRPIQGSEERFTSRGVRLWPSKDSRSGFMTLLCPSTLRGTLGANSDERSIIYPISSPGLPPEHQYLVLISFDPKINFMNPINWRTSDPPSEGNSSIEDLQRGFSGNSLLKVENPLYQVIRRGYWLR